MLVVHRVEVRASLDDPQPTLERARQEASAGDSSWAQWVAEYERGEAVIVRLDVKLFAVDGDDGRDVVEVSNQGVFVEKPAHVPQLEQQIAEMTSKDYGEISATLREHGHPIDTFELGGMYVHVELDPALRATLADPGTASSAPREQPAGEAALSRPADPAAT